MTKRKQMSIVLAELKISKTNMRYGRKKPFLDDILPSIKERGILQPALVRREGQSWGIVAGARRFWCMKEVARTDQSVTEMPCIVLKADDDASAIEASLIENIAHLPPSEMQQYEAFGRLEREGKSVEEIAHIFGITELAVRRGLALANLSKPIRKLYAEDKISRETAKALTLATPDQQAKWLKLYSSKDDHAPRGASCRIWVTGGSRISTDHALFELDQYDGTIVEDLFGEESVFTDPDMFWEAQSRAIADLVAAYEAKGWRDVIVQDRGKSFHSWDHHKRPRTRSGKVYIEISHSGRVLCHEGYVSQAENRKIEQAEAEKNGANPIIKPEMSGPMRDYINNHRHSAASASLLRADSTLALKCVLAHMLAGSALWSVTAHDQGRLKDETIASLDASPARQALVCEGKEIAKLLASKGLKLGDEKTADVCDYLAALMAMTLEETMRILTHTMALSLECGGALVEAVLYLTGCDLGDYWQPDEAFFNLLRDKRSINALLGDIARPSVAEGMITETGKAQKEAIKNRLRGNGVPKARPDWRPKWMKIPPARHIKSAPNCVADNWLTIAGVFKDIERYSAPVETDKTSRKAA
jgi:ParB family chromosome partitioning protein